MMHFPPGRDRTGAQRLIEAFPEPVGSETTMLLECLGGNSPYLAELALREPKTLCAVMAQGPDAVCDLALGRLARAQATGSRAETAVELRLAKRHVALATAIADIGGAWTLEEVTSALSDLAEGALRLAAAHLLHAAHERGDLRLPHPAAPDRGSGFAVLAMGKLGARELNFSSDIDLILIYESGAHPYTAESNGATFARLARDLVSLMQHRDANGYVFRTDLRLRPDPASTPLAVELTTALGYYESTAHTWERAAMIKARPVAGDVALGRRFLEAIKPFVWRRHLDFAAIADIRAMKHRVDAHKGTSLAADGTEIERLLGHDVKLGAGGIREIEFCAQTLQLVWGGRNPALRSSATLPALRAAACAGHLTGEMEAALAIAYRTLRQVEHRLQMVDDRQTHCLPETRKGFADFAAFFGAQDAEAFAAELLAQMERVHDAFTGVLENPTPAPDIVYAGPALTLPVGVRALPAGQKPPWNAWLEGKPRALRTIRARALLRDLLPSITAVVQSQTDPEAVWARLDEFIHRLPAGVQFFSMLSHNPALLERLGAVLGAAPSLADHLASVPSALEGLMAPDDIDRNPGRSLASQLHDAGAVDEALTVASRFVRGEEFRLAVAELDGRIDQDAAGMARTSLAEAAMKQLLPRVLADHARRYGRLRGGGMVVVALGKAGSREMMAGSDLDLMLVYDHAEGHPADVSESSRRVRLPASQYFARAAQAVVAALTVPTRDGKLYEVDMRLRPSGGKGPVAVSLSAFERYHRESAWTWERLALTRARVVAGPRKLAVRVSAAIRQALQEGDPATVLADTAALRRRLLAELPPQGFWDVKLRRGGLLEVEFIAQALQLRHARDGRAGLDPTPRVAFKALAGAGIIGQDQAARLIAADAVWRATQGLLRIALGRRVPAVLPAPLEARLLRRLDVILGSEADRPPAERIQAVADDVSAAFQLLVGDGSGS
jgi:glutamate-ammonia-ligase adenylyltransferase